MGGRSARIVWMALSIMAPLWLGVASPGALAAGPTSHQCVEVVEGVERCDRDGDGMPEDIDARRQIGPAEVTGDLAHVDGDASQHSHARGRLTVEAAGEDLRVTSGASCDERGDTPACDDVYTSQSVGADDGTLGDNHVRVLALCDGDACLRGVTVGADGWSDHAGVGQGARWGVGVGHVAGCMWGNVVRECVWI